jgi:hypothetical protein
MKRYMVGTHMPTLYCDMHLVAQVNRRLLWIT